MPLEAHIASLPNTRACVCVSPYVFPLHFRPPSNAVYICGAAWDEALTRMGTDTHQTRYVPKPAPAARVLSILATSAAVAQWQRLWHMSQSFKCLFFSWGWLGEPAREEMTFCVVRGGLVVAPSCCLHQLSVPVSSEHITTPTNKPCHLETPALVTMLSSSTTGATHRHSLIGPKTHMYCTHTHTHNKQPSHTFSTIFPSHCVPLRHWYTHLDRHVHKAQTHTTCDPQSNPHQTIALGYLWPFPACFTLPSADLGTHALFHIQNHVSHLLG